MKRLVIYGPNLLLTHLDAKWEDLEDRSRSNNICLVGFPEGNKASYSTEYFAQLLQDVSHLREKPLLERGHCTLDKNHKKGQSPCPLFIRVQYLHVCTDIQRAAEHSPLNYNRKRLSIFANYIRAVVRKHFNHLLNMDLFLEPRSTGKGMIL